MRSTSRAQSKAGRSASRLKNKVLRGEGGGCDENSPDREAQQKATPYQRQEW